jgi:hypothetical protein
MLNVSVIFEPRELWVGVHWNSSVVYTTWARVKRLTNSICILPCLPIIVTIHREQDRKQPRTRHAEIDQSQP